MCVDRIGSAEYVWDESGTFASRSSPRQRLPEYTSGGQANVSIRKIGADAPRSRYLGLGPLQQGSLIVIQIWRVRAVAHIPPSALAQCPDGHERSMRERLRGPSDLVGRFYFPGWSSDGAGRLACDTRWEALDVCGLPHRRSLSCLLCVATPCVLPLASSCLVAVRWQELSQLLRIPLRVCKVCRCERGAVEHSSRSRQQSSREQQ